MSTRSDESSTPDRADADESNVDPADPDCRTETRCYRCDRPIEPDSGICLTTKPGPSIAGTYEAISRHCCPDCVAALGLLEFVDPRRTGSD